MPFWVKVLIRVLAIPALGAVGGIVTSSNIAAFARLWRAAVRQNPPEPSSGLVEQQRIFMKLGRS